MVKKVCPEGKKLTKTGNRCIKIREPKPKKITIKAYGQRQTVCYEGYKMTKDGKCIKDKKYKTIVVPVETLMTGDLISFEEVAKVPSVKKSVSRTSSYKKYMDSRIDEF
jgi:ribosomal protein S17